MKRRLFLNHSAGLSLGILGGARSLGREPGTGTDDKPVKKATTKPYPLAITMWEFSWLERRWPGAGYEDWDRALAELVDREDW